MDNFQHEEVREWIFVSFFPLLVSSKGLPFKVRLTLSILLFLPEELAPAGCFQGLVNKYPATLGSDASYPELRNVHHGGAHVFLNVLQLPYTCSSTYEAK